MELRIDGLLSLHMARGPCHYHGRITDVSTIAGIPAEENARQSLESMVFQPRCTEPEDGKLFPSRTSYHRAHFLHRCGGYPLTLDLEPPQLAYVNRSLCGDPGWIDEKNSQGSTMGGHLAHILRSPWLRLDAESCLHISPARTPVRHYLAKIRSALRCTFRYGRHKDRHAYSGVTPNPACRDTLAKTARPAARMKRHCPTPVITGLTCPKQLADLGLIRLLPLRASWGRYVPCPADSNNNNHDALGLMMTSLSLAKQGLGHRPGSLSQTL